ncbi:MAG: tetratricopeptide repeat protein [Anaerolineales bacterium]
MDPEPEINDETEESTRYAADVEAYTQKAREHMGKREWDEALETYERLLTLQKSKEDRAGLARTRNDIGTLYLVKRDWPAALDTLERALPAMRDAGEQEQEAVALNNIAAAHHEMGNWREALETYEEALNLRREMEDVVGEAKTLRNIGVLYGRQGNMMQAKIYLNRAVIVAKQARSHDLVKVIRKSLSQLQRRRP